MESYQEMGEQAHTRAHLGATQDPPGRAPIHPSVGLCGAPQAWRVQPRLLPRLLGKGSQRHTMTVATTQQ